MSEANFIDSIDIKEEEVVSCDNQQESSYIKISHTESNTDLVFNYQNNPKVKIQVLSYKDVEELNDNPSESDEEVELDEGIPSFTIKYIEDDSQLDLPQSNHVQKNLEHIKREVESEVSTEINAQNSVLNFNTLMSNNTHNLGLELASKDLASLIRKKSSLNVKPASNNLENIDIKEKAEDFQSKVKTVYLNKPQSSSSAVKKEPELNLNDGKIYLEEHILQDARERYGTLKTAKFLRVVPEWQKKLQVMSKILDESLQSSALRPSTSSQIHYITKAVNFDPNDLPTLPDTVLAEYNGRKYVVKLERACGPKVHVYNVPYYICTICVGIFMSHESFFGHFKRFHAKVDKPFNCWKCPKPQPHAVWGDLRVHLKTHMDVRTFSCKTCFNLFKTQESLHKHVENVHTTSKISCDVCGRNFETRGEMLTHKSMHAAGKGQIIKIGSVSSVEMQNHSAPKPGFRRCIFCQASFSTNEELERHYEGHKSLVWMKCRDCTKKVMVNPQFILQNKKLREFKCVKCTDHADDEFSGAQGYVEPKSTNLDRSTQKPAVTCYVCGIEVSSNIKLFYHMKQHLDRKQFKCSICHEEFVSREDLIEHSQQSHAKNKATKCEICNKEFHFVDLATHMKVHERNKNDQVQDITVPHCVAVKEEDISSSKPGIVQVKTVPNAEPLTFYGSKCPICNLYVPYRDSGTHKFKHELEQRMKLIQKLQSGRKNAKGQEEAGSSTTSTLTSLKRKNDGLPSRVTVKYAKKSE